MDSCTSIKKRSFKTAPFPYFGGKRRVAGVVWQAIGDVATYVEPFFGSGSVLLSRESPCRREIINDLDANVCNFWRAVKFDPDGVHDAADWPVTEVDLIARNRWLTDATRAAELAARLRADRDAHDVRIAGTWLWVMSLWIGGRQKAETGDIKKPRVEPNGIVAAQQRGHAREWIAALSTRLRHVVVLCGDWSRCFSHTATLQKHAPVGVFLDPPYDLRTGRDGGMYKVEKGDTTDVGAWCRARGRDRQWRIVLAGLEGEYDLPGWRQIGWTRPQTWLGRFDHGSAPTDARERLWISPHCEAFGLDLHHRRFAFEAPSNLRRLTRRRSTRPVRP